MAGSRSLRERPSCRRVSRAAFSSSGASSGTKPGARLVIFEAPPMTGATIYPDRDQLVVELAVGGGIAALVGFILLDTAWEALFGNGLGDIGGVAATAAFVFVLLIIFPAVHLLGLRGAVDAARELRHPLPLVCLDGDGFECSAGRVRWRDVERISHHRRTQRHPGVPPN